VLAGDVLYCRAMELCLEGNLETSALLLARASRRMAQAEAAETERQGDLNRSAEGCVGLAREKTGSLFSAASEIGAHLGDMEDERDRFAHFGEHLGTAFQIVDDVLDYAPSGPDWGKRPLQDLRQQRATLPLILALDAGAITGWPAPGTALGVLQKCGALDQAMRTARQEAEEARATLRGIDRDAGRNALEELCRLVTERQR
jgi:octaprenyl-diphosphate synthase